MTPNANYQKTLKHLQGKKKILFLTTSNRWSKEKDGEIAKSTRLAKKLAGDLGDKVTLIDVPKLKIYPCEGNVSTAHGNICGVKGAFLKDPSKNPSGQHRCWASINNNDDELWKISKELLASDCVVFFSSVRWGQTNAHFQKLIERLTWLENRHSTLGESNILANIEAGIILIGQNWRGDDILSIEKQVLSFFGFRVENRLCWNWQFTHTTSDESNESYLAAAKRFEEMFM